MEKVTKRTKDQLGSKTTSSRALFSRPLAFEIYGVQYGVTLTRESFLRVLDLAREFIECTDPIVHVCALETSMGRR